MTCSGCKIGYFEALRLFHLGKKCLEVINQHGITDIHVKCTECNEVAKLSEDNSFWYCKNGHNFERLARPDDWLESLHSSPVKCCIFMSLYLHTSPPYKESIRNELKMSHRLANSWFVFMQEILQDWCLHNSVQELGGRNIVVEIDEAELEDNKYSGRSIPGNWVFSACERNSSRFFFEVVPKRSSSMLVKLIKKKIRPGSKILFTYRTVGSCLKKKGFDCLKADYTVRWLNPKTNTYSENPPENIPECYPGPYKSDHIANKLYRQCFVDLNDRIHHFLLAVKNFKSRNSDALIRKNVKYSSAKLAFVMFYFTCCVYSVLASIFFHQVLVKYDLYHVLHNNDNNTRNS